MIYDDDDQLSDFEEIVNTIKEALGDESITFDMFRLAEQDDGAPMRRVIWIPGHFECGSPESTNPQVHDGISYDVLQLDELSVLAIITGESFRDADRIRRKVLVAVKKTLATRSLAVDGSWDTETVDGASIALGGNSRVSQRFLWKMNVIADEQQMTRVRTIQQSNTNFNENEDGTTEGPVTINLAT